MHQIKTAVERRWDVLLKMAEVDPVIRKIVDKVAKRYGTTPPTDAQTEQWQSQGKSWQESPGFQAWLKAQNAAEIEGLSGIPSAGGPPGEGWVGGAGAGIPEELGLVSDPVSALGAVGAQVVGGPILKKLHQKIMKRAPEAYEKVPVRKEEGSAHRLYKGMVGMPTGMLAGSWLGKTLGAAHGAQKFIDDPSWLERYTVGKVTPSQKSKILRLAKRYGRRGAGLGLLAGAGAGMVLPGRMTPKYIRDEYLTSPRTALMAGLGAGGGIVAGRAIPTAIASGLQKALPKAMTRMGPFGRVVGKVFPTLGAISGGLAGGEVGALLGHKLEAKRLRTKESESKDTSRSTQKTDKGSALGRWAVTGVGGIAGIGASIVPEAGRYRASKGLTRAQGPPTIFTPKLMRRFLKAEGFAKDFPIRFTSNSRGAGYSPKPKYLVIPRKTTAYTVAHEVGHATGGKLRQGLMRGRRSTNKGESMPWTGYAAPLVAAGAPALVQAEEALANRKAVDLLRKAKIKVPGLKRVLGYQTLNYAASHTAALFPIIGATYFLRRYLEKHKNTVKESKAKDSSHIAVDLDGTLAKYDKWRGVQHVGAPIPPMVKRVKNWLDQGRTVKILTARMAGKNAKKARPAIDVWMKEHIGQTLPLTSIKDPKMSEIWDDRAVQVIPNTGQRADRVKKAKPYRNRVDVYAVDKKGLLYSGKYPDGSIALFGGGIDAKEKAIDAGKREFLEEAGRKVTDAKMITGKKLEESLIARKGWLAAGKTERAKKYDGTRTHSIVAKLVEGKKAKLTEPADHITDVKARTFKDAVKAQQKALKKPDQGKAKVLKHRLGILKKLEKEISPSGKKIAESIIKKFPRYF